MERQLTYSGMNRTVSELSPRLRPAGKKTQHPERSTLGFTGSPIGAVHVLSRHVTIHHINVTGHVHEEIEEAVQAQSGSADP
jgi:hypothetical protein